MAQSLKTYIMCGGSGTRLWPLSRADNPKQFLRLLGEQSMLEATIERTVSLRLDVEVSVNIIGADAHRDTLAGLSPSVDDILIEPMGRNTAAAVALAALHAEGDDDPYVLILPSDSAISTVEQFTDSIAKGISAAVEGNIVVFGIEPDRPATGYGYIEAASADTICAVVRFVEKPDAAIAETYCTSGRHLWNAGILLARASVLLAELEAHAADILHATQAAFKSARSNSPVFNFDPELYAAIRAQSIDYAVIEMAENVSVVRAAFSWSDIGSFEAMKDNLDTNDTSNAVQGDVIALESKGNLLRSEGPLVTTLGVDNLAIVATPDATFVAPLARSEDVKKIVAELETKERRELYQTPWKAECGVVPGAMSERFRDWLFDIALPFWAEQGLDQKHGGFHEVLDFER